ncbi:class D beta-lactamase [Albibacillus kandeliae]|uniref:class D beta-lactamase n=1 Tax=Albibacillus kandeliae TaxID=2174228 RepID=UPI000D686128|nr:class D beta-lactamase [Albibacillus kandeliae]
MKKVALAAAAGLVALVSRAAAEERVVCTLAWELGSTEPLVSEGECDTRMSSASTFKIAISLMGFDSGILSGPDLPEWPLVEGYADWRPEWKRPQTPRSWLKYSVVWYSQQITQRLGPERFESYVHAFGYGNEDVSGDPGKSNGLTRAWLSSSLQISPQEQVAFLGRMLEGELPVSEEAVAQTRAILDHRVQPEGWETFGKTGAGLPFGPDGTHLKGQPFGWYVGWAEKGERRVMFARLSRFDARPERTPGEIARDGLLGYLFASDGPLS